ncbi:MAG: DUF1385 domain-containing protein [Clostridia bacterium]|nr:DUF1385 domain-containing protein [Clostridia bacterium]
MKQKESCSARLGRVGGQAVLEGVMKKSGDRTALAVRDEAGEIRTSVDTHTSVRKKYKFLNIPLVRGVVNFVETMILSYNTLMQSADMLGIDDAAEDSKFEAWLRSKWGDKFMAVLMGIATVLGLVVGLGLFLYLPAFVTKWLDSLLGGIGWFRNVIEGVMKIAIFVAYIALCSLMKEMRRTFEYHGAEHKSIACYESGMELTPANAMKCTRFHPRCGTSFLFVILILSILVNSLISWDNLILRVALKVLLLPVIVGLGFEFIMYAGKHTNVFTRILSAPGLWMQRITTREPDEAQLEIAITALKLAMPDEFPPADDASENSADAEITNG